MRKFIYIFTFFLFVRFTAVYALDNSNCSENGKKLGSANLDEITEIYGRLKLEDLPSNSKLFELEQYIVQARTSWLSAEMNKSLKPLLNDLSKNLNDLPVFCSKHKPEFLNETDNPNSCLQKYLDNVLTDNLEFMTTKDGPYGNKLVLLASPCLQHFCKLNSNEFLPNLDLNNISHVSHEIGNYELLLSINNNRLIDQLNSELPKNISQREAYLNFLDHNSGLINISNINSLISSIKKDSLNLDSFRILNSIIAKNEDLKNYKSYTSTLLFSNFCSGSDSKIKQELLGKLKDFALDNVHPSFFIGCAAVLKERDFLIFFEKSKNQVLPLEEINLIKSLLISRLNNNTFITTQKRKEAFVRLKELLDNGVIRAEDKKNFLSNLLQQSKLIQAVSDKDILWLLTQSNNLKILNESIVSSLIRSGLTDSSFEYLMKSYSITSKDTLRLSELEFGLDRADGAVLKQMMTYKGVDFHEIRSKAFVNLFSEIYNHKQNFVSKSLKLLENEYEYKPTNSDLKFAYRNIFKRAELAKDKILSTKDFQKLETLLSYENIGAEDLRQILAQFRQFNTAGNAFILLDDWRKEDQDFINKLKEHPKVNESFTRELNLVTRGFQSEAVVPLDDF